MIEKKIEKNIETSEPQIETQPANTEEKESQIDSVYAGLVGRYFGRRKEDLMRDNENPSDEDLKYETFLNEQQSNLVNLANRKNLEKAKSKDYSFALSELAGMMAANREQDPNSNIDTDKEYREAKQLFMATCQKLFPEIKPEVTRDIPSIEAKQLNNLGLGGGSIPSSESGRLLREDPKKLAIEIDQILKIDGNAMKIHAFEGFETDLDTTKEEEKRLGTAIPLFYKLQLMRDQLTKQIYGREDIPPSEQRQIDQTREKIK
jgi:hypothetical protein